MIIIAILLFMILPGVWSEGATVRAKAAGSTGEPESIPAMPYYLMLMMACLVGLFGLRQFRA